MYALMIKFITILEMLNCERYVLVLWVCGDTMFFNVKEIVSFQLVELFDSLSEHSILSSLSV